MLGYLNIYIDYLTSLNRAFNTIAKYSRVCRRFIDYLSNIHNISSYSLVDERIALEYIDIIKQKYASNTYNSIITCISKYFDWLVSQSVVEYNFFVGHRNNTAFNVRSIKSIESDVLEFMKMMSYKKASVYAAFACMLGTGARLEEVCNLRKNDIILNSDNTLSINIKNAKYNSDRIAFFLNTEYANIVLKYVQKISTNFYVFPPSRNLQYYCVFYKKRIGINVTSHSLRHFFAYSALMAGYNIETIQHNLGHKTISMSTYYAAPAFTQDKYNAPAIK